jgi:hypothetical protein
MTLLHRGSRVAPLAMASSLACPKPARRGEWRAKTSGVAPAKAGSPWSVVCCPLAAISLLNHFFELLAKHLNVTGPATATATGRVEAIDGDVKPIPFFSFHHELIPKTVVGIAVCGIDIGFVVAGLGDQID